jgi:hypothetical protein
MSECRLLALLLPAVSLSVHSSPAIRVFVGHREQTVSRIPTRYGNRATFELHFSALSELTALQLHHMAVVYLLRTVLRIPRSLDTVYVSSSSCIHDDDDDC